MIAKCYKIINGYTEKRYGKCESVSRKLCIFLAFLEAFCIFIAKKSQKVID